MTILQQILAASGFGALRLETQVYEPVHPRGTVVHGSVRVRARRTRQNVSLLTVNLVASSIQRDLPDRVLASTRIASAVVTEPGSVLEFSFECPIPESAPLSRGGWVPCRIRVEAGIPGDIQASAEQYLTVIPEREILAVQLALERLGFAPTGPSHTDPAGPAGDGRITQRYLPPPELGGQLGGVSLSLLTAGDMLCGWIELHRREHGAIDTVRSALQRRGERPGIVIPRAQLLNSDGSARPEGSILCVEAILRDALAMPGDWSKRLLHPASAPDDSDRLLRPAATCRSSASELLRPADPGQREE